MFDDQTRDELLRLGRELLEGIREDKDRQIVGALAARLAAMACDAPHRGPKTVCGIGGGIVDVQLRSAMQEALNEAIDPLTNPGFDIETALSELLLLARSILDAARRQTVDPQLLMEAGVRLALFVHYVDVWIAAGRSLPSRWRARLARHRARWRSTSLRLC